MAPPNADPSFVDIDGEDFAAVSTLLGGAQGMRPLAIVMKSRTQAMRPYREIQFILLWVGLFVAVVGISATAVVVRKMTVGIAKLVDGTRQVATGNYDFRIDVPSNDEIRELAESFNVMTQGLREKEDMEKFVSQSTVEMIQSNESEKVSAGERTTLTILFSDMRGFTAMTEQLAPEANGADAQHLPEPASRQGEEVSR